MHIYRFKIKFEDQDEFQREFEIRSDQSFEDFFLAVVENLNLNAGTLSSFFICDHKFRKKSEISLVDMNPETGEEGGKPVLIMSNCRLSDYIDDPHQKLLLVYDYLNYWTFYIELLKIIPANPAHSYPRLFRSEGEVPRELLPLPPGTPTIIGEEGLDFSFEEDGGYDQEDLDAFEGEEDFLGERGDNLESLDDDKAL